MSRYIDADEFLENESEAYMRAQVNLAKENADKTIDPTRYVNEAVHKKIQMLINATESADVAEVVRCKDCKWYMEYIPRKGESAMMCFCNCCIGGQGKKKPTDYCSYGERKEK